MLGIKNYYRNSATQSVAASTVLVDATGLSHDLPAASIIHMRGVLLFTVGAAGGAKFQLVVPAAGTSFQLVNMAYNTVADTFLSAYQAASAAIGDAFANAGSHFMMFEADIVNGATAGTAKIQFAQNSSDATACQLLLGSYLEVTVLQ